MSKKTTLLLTALVAVMVVFGGLWYFTRETPQTGEKALTVMVVHGDQTQKEFQIRTDAEYLADALVENEIVVDNQSTFGLYILTADGETVDEDQQEWWCITKGGETLLTGASETPIADGEAYELTFTVGYGF